MKQRIRVSVRELVDALGRSGDLNLEFPGTSRAIEGIGAHRLIQTAREGDYAREVSISYELESDHFLIEISGRIDGILRADTGLVVEEIKSTRRDLADTAMGRNPLHWAQLKIYAFILAQQEGLSGIEARLTYYQLDTGQTREFKQHFRRDELEGSFHEVVSRFTDRLERAGTWCRVRDASIAGLEFPFSDFRPGQRRMAVEVFRSIRDRDQLIIQAATGIGKTLAVIFPALKAMSEGKAGRIFYLTARTTGRTVAEKAIEALRGRGLRLKTLTLTAKEKVCFKDKPSCSPEACEYARGYYDRIEAALNELDHQDGLTRDILLDSAQRYGVCPFEFSLDLALRMDFIICDYNYAFDPRVYLRRIFSGEKGDCVLLVDEAHNLVSRAREMFSANLCKQKILDVRRPLRDELPDLYGGLGKINAWFRQVGKGSGAGEDFFFEKDPPSDLYPLLRAFLTAADKWLSQNIETTYREGLQDLFFEIRNFMRVSECYDACYVTCYERNGRDLRIKLFCMDPASNLRKVLDPCRSAIFFSATMTPLHHFKKILGCRDTAGTLELGSPFPAANLCLLVADGISTRYRQRDRTKGDVARMILSIARKKAGNYLFFFPSYKYMTMVYEVFCREDPRMETMLQAPDMSEDDREAFLARFSGDNPKTLVGFAVMGGIFGEGIDLVGDRLTGAAVVGVGLPGISAENELIRNHFNQSGRAGFEAAYLYPGFNRVLQAAGRVIRTEQDRGVVLLVDERFSTSRYRSLFPGEWRPKRLHSPEELGPILEQFWNKGRHAPGSG